MAAHAMQGQALVEALVIMGLLASAALAMAWLAQLQDIGAHAQHASRLAAFAHAHQGMAPAEALAFAQEQAGLPAWHDRQGRARVHTAEGHVERSGAAPDRQVGDPRPDAALVRRELRLDEPVWVARVGLHAGEGPATGLLRDFDGLALRLRRHTAILPGTGAAAGDAQVQTVLGSAGRLWADTAGASQALARQAQARLQPLDAAWHRPELQTDWLSPWAGWVPERHLRPGGQP